MKRLSQRIAIVLLASGVVFGALPAKARAAGSAIDDEGPTAGGGKKTLLYPVNRLADFMDIFTLQLGFGLGLHANGHATRALQFGLGGAAVSRVGLDGRQIGVCNQSQAEFSLLPFSSETFKRQNSLGSFKEFATSRDRPLLYKKYRDYWAIGGEATAALVNVGVELHPLEIPDFFLGIVGVDILRDDLPQPPDGFRKISLAPGDAQQVKRVVIVPSRVLADPSVRLGEPEGIGVYYARYPREKFFGRLGTLFGRSADEAERGRMNEFIATQKFQIHRELLDRTVYTMEVNMGWKTVDIVETLNAFEKGAVEKTFKRQKIRRLPDYRALAQQYNADAVMDVRVWEWGVFRDQLGDKARVRLDCEYKLIKFPENRVVFDTRVTPQREAKQEIPLAEFESDNGATLVRESKEACDVVHAIFTDILIESK